MIFRREKEDLEKRVSRSLKNSEMMSVRGRRWLLTTLGLIVLIFNARGQEEKGIVDYLSPGDYIIDSISISGIKYLDLNALIGISGLRTGEEIAIPGDKVTLAVQKLWDQGLFSDIRITIGKIEGDKITLDIYLQERPRLSSLKLTGIKTSESQDLIEKIALPNGSQITAFILNNTERIIKNHYIEKGFLDTEVSFIQKEVDDDSYWKKNKYKLPRSK